MDHLRASAPGAYLGRDLRVRRQRAAGHVVVRRPAHLPGAAVRRSGARRPAVLGLPAVHRDGRVRLRAGRHPVARIRRAGVVRRCVAHRGLGDLPDRLPRHHPAPPRAAHLRRQLVLSVLHRDRGDAAHRQQPGRAGVGVRGQELLGLRRRAGRAHPVVVWPQRRRLLPDRRLPRHDVLLHSRSRRSAPSTRTGCRSSTSGR